MGQQAQVMALEGREQRALEFAEVRFTQHGVSSG
jgi:hypothetical protein